jgi:hypothetical protein
VKKRDNVKLERYLNRNRALPVAEPLRLEYSSLPPPRRHAWRAALGAIFGAGGRLGIALGCLGAGVAIGLWQEPTALAAILLAAFTIVSLLVLIAMLRR